MKNPIFLHLLWIIIAITSFIVGSQYFGTKNEPNVTSSSQSQTNPTRSATRTRSSLSSQPENTSQPIQESQSLGPEGINLLGENLRAATDPITRRIAFAKILEALTPENALLLREQIAHLPQKSPEYREFHFAWGRIAGEAAAAHCATSPEADMASALAGWSNANPEAALAYFTNLSPDDTSEYHQLPTGIASGLAHNHPDLAIQFVKDRLEGGDRYTVRLLNTVVDSLIQNHPAETLATLTSEVPRGDLLNSISHKVVQHLSDTDPSQAYAWASALPNGKAKFQGIGASFARWADKDPVEAANHLANVPENERNSAIYGFSSRAAYDDPVTALEWASTITVEKTRNNAVFDAGSSYFRKDPEAAAQWLPTSGLPQDMQQQLRSKFKVQ